MAARMQQTGTKGHSAMYSHVAQRPAHQPTRHRPATPHSPAPPAHEAYCRAKRGPALTRKQVRGGIREQKDELSAQSVRRLPVWRTRRRSPGEFRISRGSAARLVTAALRQAPSDAQHRRRPSHHFVGVDLLYGGRVANPGPAAAADRTAARCAQARALARWCRRRQHTACVETSQLAAAVSAPAAATVCLGATRGYPTPGAARAACPRWPSPRPAAQRGSRPARS